MRRPWLAGVLGVLLITVAWWMFLISPRNAKISDVESETAIAVDTESRLRAQISQLQRISDREVEYLAAIGKLDSLVPDRPLLEEFIEQVTRLAIDTNVALQTIAPSLPSATDESELREIRTSVQLEGEFFEVLGFLFGLNDMDRLVRVDAIALSSSEDELGDTVLSVSLEVRMFTLADLLPISDDLVSADGDTSGDGSGTDAEGSEASDGGEESSDGVQGAGVTTTSGGGG